MIPTIRRMSCSLKPFTSPQHDTGVTQSPHATPEPQVEPCDHTKAEIPAKSTLAGISKRKKKKGKEKKVKILKKHRCPADISVTDIYYSTCFTVCQYLFKKSFGILRFYSHFTVLQFLYSTVGSCPMPFHSSSVVSSSSSASSFTDAVGAMRAWASGFASTARRIPSSLTWVYIWVVFSCS